jgi:hypothetical protein
MGPLSPVAVSPNSYTGVTDTFNGTLTVAVGSISKHISNSKAAPPVVTEPIGGCTITKVSPSGPVTESPVIGSVN